MVAMETTTLMKFFFLQLLVNIFKLFKGAKFDYDQIKERKCYQELKFSQFCF